MNKGFTILELLIVIALASLLATLALPNMFRFIEQNRVATLTNDWMTSLTQARVEALKIRQRVTVCASNNPFDNAPACGGNWDDGWIIIADTDGDEVADTVLDAHAPVHDSIDILGNFLNNSVTFNADGFLGGAAGTLRICADRDPASTRATSITVNSIGRVRLADDVLDTVDCS